VHIIQDQADRTRHIALTMRQRTYADLA